MASNPKAKKKEGKRTARKMAQAKQSALFEKTAKELKADETGKAFERTMKVMASLKK
jgi:hypothetical protein